MHIVMVLIAMKRKDYGCQWAAVSEVERTSDRPYGTPKTPNSGIGPAYVTTGLSPVLHHRMTVLQYCTSQGDL